MRLLQIVLPRTKGLYQNILITGTIGTGKTSSAMYPFTKQLIEYNSNNKKEKLGLFPTPLHYLPNMSKELGTNVWIKRDDLCGVALGGNKVRKLEYLLADAKAKGYDLVMTTGQAQSNHAMLTAACAKRLGLDCILVLKERGVTARKGNQILNYLMDAEVRFVDTDSYDEIYDEMDRIAELGIAAHWAYKEANNSRNKKSNVEIVFNTNCALQY